MYQRLRNDISNPNITDTYRGTKKTRCRSNVFQKTTDDSTEPPEKKDESRFRILHAQNPPSMFQ